MATCQALPAIPPQQGDDPVAFSDFTRMGLNTTEDAPLYWAAPVSPPYGKEDAEGRSIRRGEEWASNGLDYNVGLKPICGGSRIRTNKGCWKGFLRCDKTKEDFLSSPYSRGRPSRSTWRLHRRPHVRRAGRRPRTLRRWTSLLRSHQRLGRVRMFGWGAAGGCIL